MKTTKHALVAIAAVSMTATGCATTSGPLTAQQKVTRCIAMVGAGAVLGGIIGNNVGSGNAGDGMLAGAALGGGACAVWLAFQNEADRERMVATQRTAAASGLPQRQSWTGADGRERMVSVATTEPQPVVLNQESPGSPQICRRVTTTASVGGASDNVSEVWCRGENNEWAPAEDQTVLI